jgi:hypothetical protein
LTQKEWIVTIPVGFGPGLSVQALNSGSSRQ